MTRVMTLNRPFTSSVRQLLLHCRVPWSSTFAWSLASADSTVAVAAAADRCPSLPSQFPRWMRRAQALPSRCLHRYPDERDPSPPPVAVDGCITNATAQLTTRGGLSRHPNAIRDFPPPPIIVVTSMPFNEQWFSQLTWQHMVVLLISVFHLNSCAAAP